MKLGVICDGISRDLDHALRVMTEFGLEYAELQYVGDKEIGDQDTGEVRKIGQLIDKHGKRLSCLSRHLFAGTTVANRPGDALHQEHMEHLKRVIDMAHLLGSPLVRIMTPKKEAILWGEGGAEIWNVAGGAWDATVALMRPAIELARREGMTLAVETGNGTMIHSGYTARRLIDDLDAVDVLKVLWDPANCCWCHDVAHPDAYEEVKSDYLGHVHLKDVIVDTPRSLLRVVRFGDGQLGPLFEDIADALRGDSYDGVISLESVFHPGNGNFEDGFRSCIGEFRRIYT